MERYAHYIVDFGDLINWESNKMRNSNFETELNSYDNNRSMFLSKVSISCRNYETFKKIVEAIMPILEDEDIRENE